MYNTKLRVVGALLLVSPLFFGELLYAQKVPKHNDIVALTPNADKNVELLNNYLDAILVGNMNMVRSYLAPDYMEYGPAASDSADLNKVMEGWEMSKKQRTNESFNNRQSLSLRAKSGPTQGEWVMGWGIYHWKEGTDGPIIDLPYQVTAKIANGKLQTTYLYYDRSSVLDKVGYVTIPPNVDPDAYMIRRVIESETQAWLDNDGEEMGTYWADLPYTAHTVTDEQGKAYIITASEIGELVARLSTQKPNQPGTTFTNTNYNIRPNGNAAWVSFEQTYHYPDGRTVANLENRYLEKIDGKWKITHMTSIPKR